MKKIIRFPKRVVIKKTPLKKKNRFRFTVFLRSFTISPGKRFKKKTAKIKKNMFADAFVCLLP